MEKVKVPKEVAEALDFITLITRQRKGKRLNPIKNELNRHLKGLQKMKERNSS